MDEEPEPEGVKDVTQGHQARKRQSQDLKPLNLLDPELVFFFFYHDHHHLIIAPLTQPSLNLNFLRFLK